MSPLTEPTKLVLRKDYVGTDDPDAAAYITAVEAADTAAGQSGGLETAVKVAIHSFVKGCKADGIWPAIKASCILAGARTLQGALVPLVGPAPTNVGPFVAGDYNRKTGLVGDGSTKYLDSKRNNNADPRNSNHNAVFVTSVNDGVAMGAGLADGGSNVLFTTNGAARSRTGTSFAPADGAPNANTLFGISRASGANFIRRRNGISQGQSFTSETPLSANLFVFARNVGGVNSATASRLAFYSIGEALDLALLDARVTDLINAIGAAIP